MIQIHKFCDCCSKEILDGQKHIEISSDERINIKNSIDERLNLKSIDDIIHLCREECLVNYFFTNP